MRQVQRAMFEFKYAAVATDFGASLLLKWFGKKPEDLIEKYGVFAKGKHKGKPRGWITWCKVVEGGWISEGGGSGDGQRGRGFVAYPGIWVKQIEGKYPDDLYKRQLNYGDTCSLKNRTPGEKLPTNVYSGSPSEQGTV